MNKSHKFKKEQKLKWWGEGPWVEEPDEVTFQHEGLECLVRRITANDGMNGNVPHVFGGHLCGYVKLPENSPIHKIENLDINLECHGGVTANGEIYGQKGTWIGFDCAHSHDIVPSMIATRKRIRDILNPIHSESCARMFPEIYREIDFVIKEVQALAEQIKNYEDVD